jgi:hypothetical protein
LLDSHCGLGYQRWGSGYLLRRKYQYFCRLLVMLPGAFLGTCWASCSTLCPDVCAAVSGGTIF